MGRAYFLGEDVSASPFLTFDCCSEKEIAWETCPRGKDCCCRKCWIYHFLAFVVLGVLVVAAVAAATFAAEDFA